ncbi:Structural maintenance of chromosomes protein 3 [Boothiomyces sp. JEL0838]|nr:Structural maintenance of chromosomes protein 3 [Boothiomyces sp. JEL0838]KAJ3311379.1 Structural maintenance of chromosomes protein 3 [Boothiomyces sp. JEL0838]
MTLTVFALVREFLTRKNLGSENVHQAGFKSYKEQTVMEPFSQKLNVVVGRNGSGKSNFFWAIRFVLGDAYSNMTREERQSLLHEGAGQTTISAYVEIIFDNSDNRFPTGNKEVILRRTIGLKKDEYSLDRKSVTKSEVLNLLESAGFSRSNPYYIVPQGRVTALTNSKDTERLQLLKEVAGTKVYEQRRTESLKIMQSTEIKRQQIDELLEFIEERMEELQQEKKELEEFQVADKEKRCIEYAIYSKEQDDAIQQLEELEFSRTEGLNNAVERFKTISERQAQIEELERMLSKERNQLKLLAVEKSQYEEELNEYEKERVETELLIGDFNSDLSENRKLLRQLASEKSEIENDINEKNERLEQIIPQFNTIVEEESSKKQQLLQLETEHDNLHAKQGRFDKFKNAKQRDAYLNNQVEELKNSRDLENEQLQQIENEINQAMMQKDDRVLATTQLESELNSSKEELESIDTQFFELKRDKEELENNRKTLWREESRLSATVESLKQEVEKYHRNVMHSMDRNISKGLVSIPEIVKRLGITGYYGPVFQLFQVDESLRTATEVVAGNSLFHVVVDTDETATKILQVLNKEHLGRVTFMPLNRLKPQVANFPDLTAEEGLILMDRLEFNDVVKSAMMQIFGKAIICRNLEDASKFARKYDAVGVTFDGDRADKKGALTGGYHDYKQSRLDAIELMKVAQTELQKKQISLREIESQLEKYDKTILDIRDKITQLDIRKRKLLSNRDPLTQEIQMKGQHIRNLENTLMQLTKRKNLILSTVGDINLQIENCQSEIGTPLRKTLAPNEVQRLSELPNIIADAKSIMSKLTQSRIEIETEKNVLELSITENLQLRLSEINQKVDALQIDQNETMTNDSYNQKLDYIAKQKDDLIKKLNSLEQEQEDLNESSEARAEELEKSKAAQREDTLAMEQHQRAMDKFLTRKAVLLQKKDVAQNHIRDLGVLPEDAFEKYVDREDKYLLKQLHKVNETLKNYQHVNKKAYEQYLNFEKQREQLQDRKAELDESASSIEKLISTLDQRKNEAIEQTFEQVATNFQEVWQKLVPEGTGELSQEITQMTQSQVLENQMEHYVGVSLNVSFQPGQNLRMPQLSGGQKSLVALALIFAIQKCDPAPFYLFDEIDAALDTQYRTSVASMINELCENAQFIATTFRPELLEHAENYYGVTFMSRVSKIQSITKSQAQEFVEGQAMLDEEKIALQDIKESLVKKEKYNPEIHDDARLLRFLRSRSLKVDLAEQKLLESDKWKQEIDVQHIINNFVFEEAHQVYKLLPAYYHKTDKEGRPILIESTKNLKMQELKKVTTEDRLMKNHIFEIEKCEKYRCKASAKKHDRHVDSLFQLVDVEGVSMFQFNDIRLGLDQISKITSDYYPEILGKMVIINAPYIFTVIFSILKMVIDPRTMGKIEILGSNYKEVLLQHVDADSLPVEYGGTCQCEGGCGEIGPWNDGSVEGYPIPHWERPIKPN